MSVMIPSAYWAAVSVYLWWRLNPTLYNALGAESEALVTRTHM